MKRKVTKTELRRRKDDLIEHIELEEHPSEDSCKGCFALRKYGEGVPFCLFSKKIHTIPPYRIVIPLEPCTKVKNQKEYVKEVHRVLKESAKKAGRSYV